MQKEASPLVSFVVTYYNEPVEMLEQCIQSIMSLSLSDKEREIVLVDDGSATDMFAAIPLLIDKVVYVRQMNKGLSAARNLGIQVSTGEYLQFVDADDYLLQPSYEHCLDLVRYHRPDMVMFSLVDKPVVETPFVLPEPVSGAEYMRHNNLRASACGYIFKKNLLHELRFTPELYHEDEEFTPLLILRCESILVTDDPCYFYRQRTESITHKTDAQSKTKRLDDKEKIIYRLKDALDTLPPCEQAAISRRIDQLTMDYLYDVMVKTRSLRQLEARVRRLEKDGLFPLPPKNYTKKYATFQRLSKTRIGRHMLFVGLLFKK